MGASPSVLQDKIVAYERDREERVKAYDREREERLQRFTRDRTERLAKYEKEREERLIIHEKHKTEIEGLHSKLVDFESRLSNKLGEQVGIAAGGSNPADAKELEELRAQNMQLSEALATAEKAQAEQADMKAELEKLRNELQVAAADAEVAKKEAADLRSMLQAQQSTETPAPAAEPAVVETSEPAAAAAAETEAPAAAPEGSYPPTGISANVQKLPEWIQAGCGDAPYNCPEKEATFAIDGVTPDTMPDLAKHSNFMAEFLVANPDVYDRLKDKKTAGGVTLAQCMKTGVDNPGHPHIKTVGLVACDEESYDTFKELFDPVISARHNGYAPDAVQPTNMNMDQLSDTDIDPEGKYVLTTRVRTGRSVRGFQLPPLISFEERRKLEALCVKGLMSMEGDLKGDYFPLHGSQSYAPKPEGMPESKEEELRAMGNLFQEPDSTLLLASGMGRHWPDGRGVFHNDAKNLFVWVGEEDHLRIVSMQGDRSKPTPEGKQIKEVTARFMRACAEVQKVLKAEGSDFMHNDHLGWVLTCPSNLGTGLRAGTMVTLPKMSAREDWKTLLGKMGLQARGTGGVDSASTGGTWDISNADRVGKGEVDLVNILIEGAAQLVKWETALDAGNAEEVEAEIKAKLEA